MLPDVEEPSVYWAEDDPRAIAAHRGILAQIVVDGQPFNIVSSKGFLIDKRLSMPCLNVHFPQFYADKLEKVRIYQIFVNVFCLSYQLLFKNIFKIRAFSNEAYTLGFLQVYDQARDDMQGKLDSDKPESVWMALDGWSAITTSYIGAEICMYLFSL